MAPTIDIQEKIHDFCVECAKRRLNNCKANRRADRCNYKDMTTKNEKDKYAFEKELEGIMGEVAVFRYFKLPIEWDYICGLQGFGKVDVPPIWEVKTMKPSNRLYILPSDVEIKSLSYAYTKVGITKGGDKFVRCELLGWKMGFEIHQQADLQNLGYINTPSYYLNNRLLRQHTTAEDDMNEARRLHELFLDINEAIF